MNVADPCLMVDWAGPNDETREAEYRRRRVDHPHGGHRLNGHSTVPVQTPRAFPIRYRFPGDAQAHTETDAEFETRVARSGVTDEEKEVYRRIHYGERYVPPPAPPEFRSAATITAPIDVDDWAVEGVLRRKSLFVIGAAESAGKTQVMRELAVRAATGTGSLFGHYPIPHPLRVMVLDEENGEAEEYRRETAILATLGLERADLTSYFRASFAGMVLTDPASQRWLDGQVDKIRPDVLALDTGTSMVADEWGGEMKATMRYLRSLIVRYGCAIAVLVHLVKPSRDRRPNDPAHGSAMSHVMGQWTRVADSVALVADLGAGRLRWQMAKKVPPSTLILVKRDGVFDVVSIGEARKPSTDLRVLRAIESGGGGPGDIAEALGLSSRTVSDAVARLRKDGLIGLGHPYEVTDEGREALA